MNRRRKDGIAKIMDRVRSLIDELLDCNTPNSIDICPNMFCKATLLGLLIREYSRKNQWHLPQPPFDGLSFYSAGLLLNEISDLGHYRFSSCNEGYIHKLRYLLGSESDWESFSTMSGLKFVDCRAGRGEPKNTGS